MQAEATLAQRTNGNHAAGAPEATAAPRPAGATERLFYTTASRPQFIDITDDVRAVLARSGVRHGFAVVFSRHTTAAIRINEAEPLLLQTWRRCSRASRRGRLLPPQRSDDPHREPDGRRRPQRPLSLPAPADGRERGDTRRRRRDAARHMAARLPRRARLRSRARSDRASRRLRMTLDTAPPLVAHTGANAALDRCLDRAVAHMRSIQHADGYWWAELEANVTMAAEHLLLEHFLGIGDAARWRKICTLHARPAAGRRLLAGLLRRPGRCERHDRGVLRAEARGRRPGSAGDGPGARLRTGARRHRGHAHLHEAVAVALRPVRLGGDAGDAARGDPACRTARRSTSTNSLRWARATIVAILVVWAHKPVVAIAAERGVDELYCRPGRPRAIRFRRDREPLRWRNFFLAADTRAAAARALAVEAAAPPRAQGLRALDRRPPGSGRLVGRHPAAVGVLADRAEVPRLRQRPSGHGEGHPRPARRFRRSRGRTFTVQPCLSPVWDTALAVTGCAKRASPADDPALRIAGRWMLERGPRARRLVREGEGRRAGRLGVRVRQRQVPRHR